MDHGFFCIRAVVNLDEKALLHVGYHGLLNPEIISRDTIEQLNTTLFLRFIDN
jgi:hypothetical protein